MAYDVGVGGALDRLGSGSAAERAARDQQLRARLCNWLTMSPLQSAADHRVDRDGHQTTTIATMDMASSITRHRNEPMVACPARARGGRAPPRCRHRAGSRGT